MRAVPFAKHIQAKLIPLRIGLALAASFLVASLCGGLALSAKVRSDQQILEAISPYLATLVESQDRPEILRVLQAAEEARNTQFVVVQGDFALASTRSISEMDRPFSAPAWGPILGESRFSGGSIVSSRPVARRGGSVSDATIYSFSPFLSVVPVVSLAFVVALLTSVAFSLMSASHMRVAIDSALHPLEELRREILLMGDETRTSSNPLPILELEEIRSTISRAKGDLANARERLAEEKARKLSAESYRRLIHDLHNPVSALRQWVHIWNSQDASEGEKKEASSMVPSIADQILRQVGAARKTLEDQPEALRELDLRESLRVCWQRMQGTANLTDGRRVSILMPDEPVMVAHDPDLLQRAIANLLENGIAASRTKVDLILERSDRKAVVRVSDDGPGMNQDDLPIFLQGRGRSSKADRGALGLASANHIVRTHGGKIVYSRNESGGATFEVRLEAR